MKRVKSEDSAAKVMLRCLLHAKLYLVFCRDIFGAVGHLLACRNTAVAFSDNFLGDFRGLLASLDEPPSNWVKHRPTG